MVACPPRHIWVVYPIPHGLSLEQADIFFLEDHLRELDQRLLKSRTNSASVSPRAGCAMVAFAGLGAIGAVAAPWARARWGA